MAILHRAGQGDGAAGRAQSQGAGILHRSQTAHHRLDAHHLVFRIDDMDILHAGTVLALHFSNRQVGEIGGLAGAGVGLDIIIPP